MFAFLLSSIMVSEHVCLMLYAALSNSYISIYKMYSIISRINFTHRVCFIYIYIYIYRLSNGHGKNDGDRKFGNEHSEGQGRKDLSH